MDTGALSACTKLPGSGRRQTHPRLAGHPAAHCPVHIQVLCPVSCSEEHSPSLLGPDSPETQGGARSREQELGGPHERACPSRAPEGQGERSVPRRRRTRDLHKSRVHAAWRRGSHVTVTCERSGLQQGITPHRDGRHGHSEGATGGTWMYSAYQPPILPAPVACTRTHDNYRSHMRVHLHPRSRYTCAHAHTRRPPRNLNISRFPSCHPRLRMTPFSVLVGCLISRVMQPVTIVT